MADNEPKPKLKNIGNLNGPWSVLFRLALAMGAISIPFVVSLQVWFVTNIYGIHTELASLRAEFKGFSSAGPRYTPKDAVADSAVLRQEMLHQNTLLRNELLGEFRRLENEITSEFVRKDEIRGTQ